ncbi:MAG: phosphomannomutase/phosphoglucomutase [Nocardioidaceae bacterium]
MADVAAIFKAYDVRGLVPAQLDRSVSRAVGAAFAVEVSTGGAPSGVVVGHDMRESSPSLADAFSDGVRDAGADVVLIGLASTDELYLASGLLDLPGAMFTASHNPAAYNGIKMCRPGAVPMAAMTGLNAIRDAVVEARLPPAASSAARGGLERRPMLEEYVAHLHALVPVVGRTLTVVVDAANGMAGLTTPAVLGGLSNVDIVPMYFELDGTFPNHEANPLDPANLRDLQARVVHEGADLGLAFDGDADRCFVVDELGQLVPPSALTALIAVRALAEEPGARVVHNLISSRAVPELIEQHGGIPVRTPVGHSLIKATMARERAIFGGEHSGHYYFRDFWYADSGMLAAMHMLAAVAEGATPVSELMSGFTPYAGSGEVNLEVTDVEQVLAAVESRYSGQEDVRLDHLDGLTVAGPMWWFNVRPSNTEPLVRLNVEAESRSMMTDVRDRVLSLMRSEV